MLSSAALRFSDVRGVAVPYALIPLSPAVVAHLGDTDPVPAFSSGIGASPIIENRIGIGDILTVTVFEARAGGLFVPEEPGARPGNFVQVPPQQVDQRGRISIPFGGTMSVLGLTLAEAERTIEKRLGERALEPQVIVSLSQRHSGAVSVLGEVNSAQNFPLDPGGERVLSAIARAGGPRQPLWESLVTVQRGGAAQTAMLSEVAQHPEQNIALRPGDVLIISREPRYFIALGAVGEVNTVSGLTHRYSFDGPRLTMTDAIGRAGGLQDDRADPTAVFLLRNEPASRLRDYGVTLPANLPDKVPTVYWLNLLTPGSMFLANQVSMRSEDVLLVSNAPAVDVVRVLQAFTPVTQFGILTRSAVGQ